ncbi:hypothetical protein Hanom_Chr12g01154991 [Helianthus anomalus]
MNRRIRNRSAAVDGYLRYLKPGALAQLRDRKINARTHYRSADYQISLSRASPSSPAAVSPSRSLNAAGSTPQPDAAVVDAELPCFSPRFYGPRCPQRKKLMAVRLFCSEPSDGSGSGSAIDAFSSDSLAAH